MFKLFKLLLNKWYLILITSAAIIGQCYLQLMLPEYMGKITTAVTNPTTLGNQDLTSYIWQVGGFMIAIAAGVFVLAIIQNYLAAYLSSYLGKQIRNKVFNHVNSFSLADYNNFGTSTLITRTTNDVEQVKNITLMGIRTLVMSPTMILIALIRTINQNASLTWVIACAIPLILIIMLIIYVLAMPTFKLIQIKLDNLTTTLRESLTGIRVVRAYNQQDKEYEKFDKANTEITAAHKKTGKIMSISSPSITIIFNLTYISIYIIGLYLINNTILDANSFTILTDVSVVAQYAMQIMSSFLMFAFLFIMVPQASVSAKRINEILEFKPTINDDKAREFAIQKENENYEITLNEFINKYQKEFNKEFNQDYLLSLMNKKYKTDEKELSFANDFYNIYTKHNEEIFTLKNPKSNDYINIINKHFSNRKLKGYLEFNNVSFIYPGSKKPTLENISFKLKPGTTTAIIGSTGSGKSTLVNLIPRFYELSSGSIKLDGINIEQLPQKILRENLGFVPQQAVLFYGSIKDNMKFGKEEASDEDINEALKISQANHFVSKLPNGLDTFVSQGGKNFSGGQKQRLAIARALIKKPEIYVFDDSFSALDFKTDLALRTALKPYTKDSAVILVAQRVSTIINADNILVLNDGKLVGQGTHSELLLNCSIYQDIVKSQLDPEEVEKTIKLSSNQKGGMN